MITGLGGGLLTACLCIQSVGCPEENTFKKDGWKCTFYAILMIKGTSGGQI